MASSPTAASPTSAASPTAPGTPGTPPNPELIKAVRDKIGDASEQWSDAMVNRFLVARKDDVDKAADMLIKHTAWRKEFGAEETLQGEYKKVSEMYISSFIGWDREQNPVYVEHPGKCNPGEIFKEFGTDALLKWHVCIMETGRRLYELKGSKGVFVIIDCSGLGLSHVSSAALGYFRTQSALDQDNYPEHLAYCFVINAGWAFTTTYKAAKMFLDEKTREKVRVLGSDYQEELAKHIDLSILPEELGGKRKPAPSTWGAADHRWTSADPTYIPTPAELEAAGAKAEEKK